MFLMSGLILFAYALSDLSLSGIEGENKLTTIKKAIKTSADIESIDSNLVKPIEYTNVISMKGLYGSEKKKKFIDLILPEILIAKYKCDQTLQKVKSLEAKSARSRSDQEYINNLLKEYKAKDLLSLKNKLITHPTSIILAQASIESGWGTSRFFIEGRNIFGVWSFNKNEPRMQTKGTRDGKHIYVKKYETIYESIDDYFKVLAKGGAYVRFRTVRAETDNPYEITKTLDKYCELGELYVTKLDKQISYNDFEKYDDYKIDPRYFSLAE